MHHQLSLFDEPAAPAREYKPQTLRPYQHEAADATFSAWQAGQTPLLALATGSGKTTILADIMRRVMSEDTQAISSGLKTRRRALILAHTEEIIFQLAERVQNQVGSAARVGIVMADQNEANAQIVVATRQSLHEKRLAEVLKYGPIDYALLDECFVAGTLVDGKPIEQYKVGDSVTAYDEKTGQLKQATVTHVYKRYAMERLFKVSVAGQEIICTSHHPFLTKDGWKAAYTLNRSDMVQYATSYTITDMYHGIDYIHSLQGMQSSTGTGHTAETPRLQKARLRLLFNRLFSRIGSRKKESTARDGNLPYMRRVIRSEDITSALSNQKRQARVLFNPVQRGIQTASLLPDDGGNQSQTRLRTYEAQQSHARPQVKTQNADDYPRDGVATPGTGRQRQAASGSPSPTGKRARMANRIRRTYGRAWSWVANALQNRHSRTYAENRYRGGWPIAQRVEGAGSRQAQIGILEWVGVDRVEVLERGSDGTFGEVCTDGRVYNLEVTPYNTYLANGVVVHNCHHATEDNTYGTIVNTVREHNPDVRIAGFTATPKRTDKKALGSIFTDIAYEWLIPEGIKAGYLVPVRRLKIATQVDLSGVQTARGDYSQSKMMSILDAANWLQLAVDSYLENVHGTGRKCIAFLPRVKMSQDFADALRAHGVHAEHIDGETPKQERRVVLNQFRDGEIQCISNVAVLTEGFDAPSAGAIFLARPTRSEALYTQIIGRGLRPYPGKQDCLLVDLSVTDTKALQTGTLLGRMVACHECGTEYHFGFKACPTCGAERPKRLDAYECECGAVYPYSLPKCPQCGIPRPVEPREADRRYAGAGITTYEQLFEGTFAAWHHGEDGYFSCTMSFDDGSLVIAPPRGDEELFRLLFVPKDKGKPEVRDTGADLVELMLTADALIEDKHLRKDAGWRDPLASEKQRKFLASLGIKHNDDITKGQAAALITHKLATKQVAKFLERKS